MTGTRVRFLGQANSVQRPPARAPPPLLRALGGAPAAMSSGESGESLASRLADAEAALLFARVNEKRLSEENSRYRERCEELSTQLLEAATPAAPVATAKPRARPTRPRRRITRTGC